MIQGEDAHAKRRGRFPWLTVTVLAVAAVSLGWGLAHGGADFALSRAIRICLECIGIG